MSRTPARDLVTPQRVADGLTRALEVQWVGGRLYWLEVRPREGGRCVVVTLAEDGVAKTLTPPDFNVRSVVHGLGGAAWRAFEGGVVFNDLSTGAVMLQARGEPPRPLATPPGPCADFVWDHHRARVLAICEIRDEEGRVGDELVAITRQSVVRLGLRADFLAYPAISPDGAGLAVTAWSEGSMPWERSRLLTARFDKTGRLGALEVPLDDPDTSVSEPHWSADGALHALAETDEWRNVRRLSPPDPVRFAVEGECGRPLWELGQTNYVVTDAGEVIARCGRHGRDRLLRFAAAGEQLEELETPFTRIRAIAAADDGGLALIGASWDRAPCLARLSLKTRAVDVVHEPETPLLERARLRPPMRIAFCARDGGEVDGLLFDALDLDAPAGLIIELHGGPTAEAQGILDPDTLFWTAQGFAVLHLNYRGSCGAGRSHRRALDGGWGERDVADVVDAVAAMALRGFATERTIVRGSSAGGFTVLGAMASPDGPRIGIDRFGPSDLLQLARQTHRFEARYIDSLVAPLPHGAALYRARSPLTKANALRGDLLILQGSRDEVVPRAQSIAIAEAATNARVTLVEFPHEAHGFRSAFAIARALEIELAFVRRALGLAGSAALPSWPNVMIEEPHP